jgi:protein SCO1/2
MKLTLAIGILISVFFTIEPSYAQLNQNRPEILDNVGVEEQLGDTIPLNLEFTNSSGDTVQLGDLLESGKPVLLNPLYYDCPLLCGLVLDGVFKVIDELAWTPGEDYTIISFSIDPEETPELAESVKQEYLNDLDRRGAENGWHFLTGNESEIRKLTENIGFKYTYNEETGEYVHLASIMMLSPGGVITRYLYGIEFNEFDLRNALFESADGKIGSAIDKVLLYCYTYDPSSQSYVPVAINIMKIGGLATAIILGIFLAVFWRREKGSSQPPKIEFEK